MFDLKLLSVDELNNLMLKIKDELNSRININEFSFNFEATNDPRKGTPYVAKLFWNTQTNKIDRSFKDLYKEYGKKSVTVSGIYSATKGEIIEKRLGASWGNDYRYWYIVNEEGKEIEICRTTDSEGKMKVQKYLSTDMKYEDFIKMIKGE